MVQLYLSIVFTTYIKMKYKKKCEKIVIVGTGGHGRDVLFTISDCEQYQVVGFIDEDKKQHGKSINGLKVLGGLEWFENHNLRCVVAINENKIRKKIVERLEKKGISFCNVIHPSVIYPKSVRMGKGCMIQAGFIIASNALIKNHVIINLSCTVGHDCIIDDFVSLAPGVHISGNNYVKQGVYFGTGAVTKQGLIINEWSIIGMGSVVTRNIPKNQVWAGIPAKLKKKIIVE